MEPANPSTDTQEPRTPAPAIPWWKRRNWDRERIAVWILALAGMVLRFRYLYDFSGSPLFDQALGADVGEYYQRARQLQLGVWFPVSPDIHAPFYSYFLALMLKIGGIPFVRVAQIILNFGAWLAFYWLLRVKRTPLKVRLWFLGIAMLFPVPVFYQSELVSEALLVPLAAAFFWLRHFSDVPGSHKRRAGMLFGAGLVLGAMNLTHPLTLFFSAAEVGWELFFRRSPHRAVVLVAALLLTVGGFCAMQSAHYERFCGIQANAGFNLYLGNNKSANGVCCVRPGKRWRSVHRVAEAEAEQRDLTADEVFLKRVGRFWLRHPLTGLRLWGLKALKVCSPRELPSGSDVPPLVCFTSAIFYGRLLTPLLIMMTGFGIWRLIRARRIRFIHYFLLFASLYLAQIVTVTSGRYRMLMVVPAALFAAYGILGFNWRRFWFLVPAVFVVCGFFTVTDYGKMRAEASILYAEAAFRNGEFKHADELAAYALRALDDPDPAHCWELRGGAAERLARNAEAESFVAAAQNRREAAAERRREAQRQIDFAAKCYWKMTKVEPTFYRGWLHLAVLADNTGKIDPAGRWNAQAYQWYRKALELEPGAPDLCCEYAQFCFRQADMWYKTTVKLASGNHGICYAFALECFRLRRVECQLAVNNTLRADPSWYRSWHLAGVVAMRLNGDWARAVEYFGRAVELSPDEKTREINMHNLRNAEHMLKTSR